MDGELAGDGGADDGRPVHLIGQRAHLLLEDVGEDVEGAVLLGVHALGDRQDGLARLGQPGQLLAGPLDAEGVDAAHDDVGALDGLGRLGEVVGLDGLGDLETQHRVGAVLLDGIDDLVVEMGSDQVDLVAVLGGREGEGGRHDARAQDCDLGHDAPSRRRPRGRSVPGLLRVVSCAVTPPGDCPGRLHDSNPGACGSPRRRGVLHLCEIRLSSARFAVFVQELPDDLRLGPGMRPGRRYGVREGVVPGLSADEACDAVLVCAEVPLRGSRRGRPLSCSIQPAPPRSR